MPSFSLFKIVKIKQHELYLLEIQLLKKFRFVTCGYKKITTILKRYQMFAVMDLEEESNGLLYRSV